MASLDLSVADGAASKVVVANATASYSGVSSGDIIGSGFGGIGSGFHGHPKQHH